MSTLLLGQNFAGEAPQDEGDVRSTITVVDNDKQEAVASHAPDFNSTERDPDTEGGLTTRAVADLVVDSEQYVPHIGNANTDFAAPINNQVSTSGTAAAREAAGEWGHGTAHYSDATEPTIREGGAFDDTYFAATRPPIQDGTIDYMVPTRQPDDKTAQNTNAAANAAARAAAQTAMYQRFLDDRIGR